MEANGKPIHHWEEIITGMWAGWSKCRSCSPAHKKSTAEIQAEYAARAATL